MTSRQGQIQATSLPPAQPVFILRGHASAVGSLCFLRSNTRLLSGDSEGFVVLWDLAIKRPLAVWQAHEGSILGLRTWGPDKIISHGRDSHLRVWSLSPDDEKQSGFSTILPVEASAVPRKQPWLLHALSVATLNFCSFASCAAHQSLAGQGSQEVESTQESLIVAVPGRQDTEVELYSLPSEKQVALVPAPDQSKAKTGMVMALNVFQSPSDRKLHVLVGYESGRAVMFRQAPSTAAWEELYASTPHSQPILGLDVARHMDVFFTSAADAIVAKHPLSVDGPAQDATREATGCLKSLQTGHSGQQGLVVRSDGRILATAGWDGRVRVYSSKSLKELAVLKWHRDGVYAVALASIDPTVSSGDKEQDEGIHHEKAIQKVGRVAAAREEKTRETHWLAAGAKDGKISLWDIY